MDERLKQLQVLFDAACRRWEEAALDHGYRDPRVRSHLEEKVRREIHDVRNEFLLRLLELEANR